MSEESRQTYRDVVIAGLIAVAAATALILDTQIESRALDSDPPVRADLAKVVPDSTLGGHAAWTRIGRRAESRKTLD